MNLVVLVPVLDRPRAAARVAASLRATSDARLLFLISPGDKRELRACQAVASTTADVEAWVMPFQREHGDYARKINHAFRQLTDELWIFQGADDLMFHDGWQEAALAVHEDTGARVIGTNDLCNPRTAGGERTHSTHSLIHYGYVEEHGGTFDEPGVVLHEGYTHNFCDDELIAAARARGEYAHASDAHVQHLHPQCGHGSRDMTYAMALEPHRFSADRRRFLDRKRRSQRRPTAGRRSR